MLKLHERSDHAYLCRLIGDRFCLCVDHRRLFGSCLDSINILRKRKGQKKKKGTMKCAELKHQHHLCYCKVNCVAWVVLTVYSVSFVCDVTSNWSIWHKQMLHAVLYLNACMQSRVGHPDPVKKRIMENAYHKDLSKCVHITLARSPDLICHTQVGQM